MGKHIRYFRNKYQIKGIDPDSLWKIEGNYIILVDDDDFVSLLYDENKKLFYPVEQPEELK